MHIDDACFVVTDTETTGTRADANRIIELAAVKVCAGVVVERFSQLIDPGCAIPGYITRLTGISTAMVFGKPRVDEVLPAYMDFLGEGVLVAHNLPFDRRFIEAELLRIGRPRWNGQALCTLRLARRLLRGLRSKSLASVADFYGISIYGRHRALGDADATAQVLIRFLYQLGHEFAIEQLDEVISFQNRSYGQIRKPATHLQRIQDETLPQLPDAPGVYFMKNGKGEIIYIGKALSLKARVRSYFNAVEAHSDHLRRLVADVREVGWKTTASELGALILESRLIKEHQPRFNRSQLEYRARPFLRLDVTHPFPRLTVSAVAHSDGAEYYGPYAGRTEAEFLARIIDEFFDLRECDDGAFSRGKACMLAEMNRCEDRPCETVDASRYEHSVDRVRRFLRGEDSSVLMQIEERMKEAAAKLDFERASEYRDAIKRLERLMARHAELQRPVFGQNGIAVCRRKDGAHVALLIGRGRLVGEFELDDGTHRWTELASAVEQCFNTPLEGRYWKEEADELRLVQHWVHRNRNTIHAVGFEEEGNYGEVLENLRSWHSGRLSGRQDVAIS